MQKTNVISFDELILILILGCLELGKTNGWLQSTQTQKRRCPLGVEHFLLWFCEWIHYFSFCEKEQKGVMFTSHQVSPWLSRLVLPPTGFLLCNYKPWLSFFVVGKPADYYLSLLFFLLPVFPSACPAPAVRTALPSGRCLSGWSPSRWASTARTSPGLGSAPWTRSCRWKASKLSAFVQWSVKQSVTNTAT